MVKKMNQYLEWPIKQLSVKSLELDPSNARMHYPIESGHEKDIIHELILNYNVEKLAKKMVQEGYFPEENIIVTHHPTKSNKFIVLEGNRRVTTLKTLCDIKKCPETKKHIFDNLLKKIDPTTIPQKINCLISPSKLDAAIMIHSKHTRDSARESWSAFTQAKSYYSLLEAGSSIEEVAERLGTNEHNVTKKIREYNLLHHCLSLKGEDDNPIIDIYDFNWTTLIDRFFNWKYFKEKFNISISENDSCSFATTTPNDIFNKTLSKISQDIANGMSVDDDKIKNVKIRQEYLDNIVGELKQDDKPHIINSKLNHIRKVKINSTSPPKITKKRTKTNNSLIPLNFECTLDDNKTQEIFQELKILNINKTPHAVAMLHRSLLQVALLAWLKKEQKSYDLFLDSKKNKNDRKGNKSPALGKLFKFVVNDSNPLNIDSSLRSILESFCDQKNNISCGLSVMNQTVHNLYKFPVKDEIINHWKTLQGFYEIILKNPQ